MPTKSIKELKKDSLSLLESKMNSSTKWIHGLCDTSDDISIGWLENALYSVSLLRSDDHQNVQCGIERLSKLAHYFDSSSHLFVRTLHEMPKGADQGMNADWLIAACSLKAVHSKIESLSQCFKHTEKVYLSLKSTVDSESFVSIHRLRCLVALACYEDTYHTLDDSRIKQIEIVLQQIKRLDLDSRLKAFIYFKSAMHIWDKISQKSQEYILKLFQSLYLKKSSLYAGPYIKEIVYHDSFEPHLLDALTVGRHQFKDMRVALGLLLLPSEILEKESWLDSCEEQVELGSWIGSVNTKEESFSRLTVPARFMDVESKALVDIQSKTSHLFEVENSSGSIIFKFSCEPSDEMLRDEISLVSVYLPYKYVKDWHTENVKQNVIKGNQPFSVVTDSGVYHWTFSSKIESGVSLMSYFRFYQGFRPSQNGCEDEFKDWILTARAIPVHSKIQFSLICTFEPNPV